MKRGILFSVMTLFMLISLVLIAHTYTQRLSTINEVRVWASDGLSLASLQSFVADDMLHAYGIQGLNINTTKSQISARRFGSLPFYGSNIGAYAAYLSTNYSTLERINITLEELSPGFTLNPFNETVTFYNRNITFEHNQSAPPRTLSFVLRTNGSLVSGTSSPSNGASGMNISIAIQDITNTTVMNVSRLVDVSAAVSAFTISFNGSGSAENVTVNFGPNGRISIVSPTLALTPQDLKMTFAPINISVRLTLNTRLVYTGRRISLNGTVFAYRS